MQQIKKASKRKHLCTERNVPEVEALEADVQHWQISASGVLPLKRV